MVNSRVFLDFAVDGAPLGRVIFELFRDSAPKTVENFRALCTGEIGLSHLSHIPLYYKNSIIHRSIPNFMIQGGDFTKHTGTGGESIYGAPFADEEPALSTIPFDTPGLLAMANKGPNSNQSQFFVTLAPCPHLNGKHTVFGRVIRGFEEVVKKIAEVPTDEKDRPNVPVVIANCGELQLVRRVPPHAAKAPASRRSRSASSGSKSGLEEGKSRRTRKRRHYHSRSSSLSRSRSRSRSPPLSRSRLRSRSPLTSRSPSHLSRSRSRTRSRSRSASISTEDSEARERSRRKEKERRRLRREEKKRRRKEKKVKEKEEKRKTGSKPESHFQSPPVARSTADKNSFNSVQKTQTPHALQETQEEYDARLEREEKERMAEARRRELEALRRRYEEEERRRKGGATEEGGGIRYKGRGKMKYIDPETRARRYGGRY